MSLENPPRTRELFAEDARTALNFAAEEAHRLNHNYIGTEHMLWGLVHLAQDKDSKGAYKEIFSRLEITTGKVESAIKFCVGTGQEPVRKEEIYLSPRSKRVIQKAVDAVQDGTKEVTPTLLLISLIEDTEGAATRILNSFGIEEKHLAELKESLSKSTEQVASDTPQKSDAELEAEAKQAFAIESVKRLEASLEDPKNDLETKTHIANIITELTALVEKTKTEKPKSTPSA